MRSPWSCLIGSILTVIAANASAQDYPNPSRPITIIVPSPAGGGIDMIARLVGSRLSTALNATVVIDNKPSAGSLIGTRQTAKAAPDGYTLLLGHTGTISINPALYANAGYDPRKDFAPIGLIASYPIALLAHPSVTASSVRDLIALAKKSPKSLSIATSVIGSGGHLAAELFKDEADIDITTVPYKGAGPLANDLIGGHVPLTFNGIAPFAHLVKEGKLRAIGVASLNRMSVMPDLPTISESGLPGFEAVLRYGLLAPVGTPDKIVTLLNEQLRAMAADRETQARIESGGGITLTSSPEEYSADIVREVEKWGRLVHKLGLKM
jgi:tripartite-type tricarboxylate transporter receptor subunit TctC